MTSQILKSFQEKVNEENEYTLEELKKLLAEAYKEGKAKKQKREKKEPSKYNIFIKEEIAKIRKENPDVENKQLMSLAAAKWKEHKATTTE